MCLAIPARVVERLAGDDAAYISGAVIPVDGGYLLNPKGHLSC